MRVLTAPTQVYIYADYTRRPRVSLAPAPLRRGSPLPQHASTRRESPLPRHSYTPPARSRRESPLSRHVYTGLHRLHDMDLLVFGDCNILARTLRYCVYTVGTREVGPGTRRIGVVGSPISSLAAGLRSGSRHSATRTEP